MQHAAANDRPRRFGARFKWLLALGLVIWLAIAQSRLQIDEHNDAMKAPGTHDAQLVDRIAATFGGERNLVLAFLARSSDRLSLRQLQQLRELRRDLKDVSGVRAVIDGSDNGSDSANAIGPGGLAAVGEIGVLLADLTATADPQSIVDAADQLCPETLRMIASGLPMAESAIAQGVALERSQLVPRIAAVLFVLLLLLYRHLGQTLAVLLPSVAAILATGGVMDLLGKRLDPISVLLEPVMLTVGVATAVHVVGSFRRLRGQGHTAARAALRTRRELQWPLLMATGTTALGFWSLLANQIPAVADFGAYAALGTTFVHIANVLVLPAWLQRMRSGSNDGHLIDTTAPDPLAAAFANWVVHHRSSILSATAVVTAAAVASWMHLRVDNDPIQVLSASTPFRKATDELSNLVGGVESFAILIDANSAAQQPDRLLPFAAAAASTAPATGLAGPVRLAMDGTLMLPVRLQPSGSDARTQLFDQIDERAQDLGFTGVQTAGLPVQIARDSDRLVRGQLVGMFVALGGLSIGLWIGLRSVRLVLIGLVPNALPCILLYGGIAALDRPLTVANVMIGSVMLGLVVDNTIHVLHRYGKARGSARRRLATALTHTSRPLLISSSVLACGFGTGLSGSMATTVEFSALAATTIVLALLSDALVLPALLSLGRQPTSS